MKTRTKIVYGLAGALAFLPLAILVVIQSIFALEASYDSKLVIDASEVTITNMVGYDQYNEVIFNIDRGDEDGQPILFSIIEATEKYVIINFHGNKDIKISGVQFELADNTKTELLRGIVYLQFKNVDMTTSSWIQDFIEDSVILYKEYYERPAGTISYIWLKIIAASVGTLLGLVTVAFIILRKSTKALVKRYWRISVLVALIEGTIILGLITWIVADIFQVFASATIGWILFLGTEKLAKIKGYLDTASRGGELSEALPLEATLAIQTNIDAILARYRK